MRSMRLVAGVCAAFLLGGCGATTPTTPTQAPPSNQGMGVTYHDTTVVAGQQPGRHAATGRGESMAPIYTDSSVLLFNPIKYDELRVGMRIAYVNSEGRRVVHQLMEKTAAGWTVMGLNNARIDTDLVTPKNLLGVVYVDFNPIPDDPEPAKSSAATPRAAP